MSEENDLEMGIPVRMLESEMGILHGISKEELCWFLKEHLTIEGNTLEYPFENSFSIELKIDGEIISEVCIDINIS